MTPSTVFQVSALTWEGVETSPVQTSGLGALDEAQKLMDAGDYHQVFIRDSEGQAVNTWTLMTGAWVSAST